MAGNTATVLAANASYMKADGYLYLTDEPYRIVWVNAESGAVTIRFSTNECTNLFANKAGAKPPKLRIVANGTEYNFVFTAAEPTCFENRDAFRDKVKELIRISMQTPAPAPATATPTTSANVDNTNGTEDAMEVDASETPMEGETAVAPAPLVTGSNLDPEKEKASRMFRLRKRILLRDPELATLHRAVVIKGKLSELDFWASRQHLIDEAAVADAQKKGKSSRLVDPRPAAATSGDMKVTMTPQLAQAIFEDWPVVLRAYTENVPGTMNEKEFWKRYFESRLYHNHRASVRSSAAQHVIKEDAVFDKYLEPVDNELEPRHPRHEAINSLVDLVMTREDHGETGNSQDFTMQAGRQRATLPLIRKFNEHSERLLNSALGGLQPVKRRRLNISEHEGDYEELLMEDLKADGKFSGIALDMKNRQRYFEGKTGEAEPEAKVDAKVAYDELKRQVTTLGNGLTHLKLDGQVGSDAIQAISTNISARTKVRAAKLDVSAEFLKQMQALEASVTEYLRQFWFLVYLPPEGIEPLSPEERGKKAGAMRDQLVWAQKRAPELVHLAATKHWDSAGVEEAFKPMMGAIDKALGFIAGRG